MIRLSNGHEFEYVAASGATGFYGKGWLHQRLRAGDQFNPMLLTSISKTIKCEPRRGNLRWHAPWRCVRLVLKDGRTVGVHQLPFLAEGQVVGAHDATGLTGPGIMRWCQEMAVCWRKQKNNLVASLHGNIDDLFHMAEHLKFAAARYEFCLVGVEINSWCPNADNFVCLSAQEYAIKTIRSCEIVKQECGLPVLLKLPWTERLPILKEIVRGVRGIVEAININSVPWHVVFPGKPSPLAHLGGGAVSGKIVQPYTWSMLQKLVDITDIPVIGPSVWEYEDIGKLRKMGAKAISFGSVFLAHPWRPTELIRRDMKEKLECLAIEAFCDMNQ